MNNEKSFYRFAVIVWILYKKNAFDENILLFTTQRIHNGDIHSCMFCVDESVKRSVIHRKLFAYYFYM